MTNQAAQVLHGIASTAQDTLQAVQGIAERASSETQNAGKVLEDERDTRIELVASQWGRGATAFCIIGIAVLLGFSDTERLREFSYPFIAQMLMLALLWGLWFDQLVAALQYWRDRRAAA